MLIESRDYLDGTLYYLKQTERVAELLPTNSRASTLVELTIHGDAGSPSFLLAYRIFEILNL